MEFFFKRLRHVLVTLRFSILSIFVTVYIISLFIVITINYIFSAKTLLFTANKMMQQSSENVYKEFRRELKEAEQDNALTAELLQDNILQFNNFQQLTQYTYNLANRFNLVQAAYWVDQKGNFVITKYENNDSLTTLIYDTQKNPEANQVIMRDVKGNVIKIENDVNIFDPRKRPWYLDAIKQNKLIWTDIYLFSPTPYLGITVASPVVINHEIKGVFGLDIRLDWLSWYVGEQKISKHGVVFLLSNKGEVIAYPGLDKLKEQTKLLKVQNLPNKSVATAFNIYQTSDKANFNFTYEGKDYLAVFLPVPNVARQNWVIGVVAPQEDFIGDLKKSNLLNILISIFILLGVIVIISYLITLLIKPIKKLVKQTEKIKNFDLDEDQRVRSRIKEVMLLSDALHAMIVGLRSFQRYVPATLVRRLIETGQNAKIGGSRRQLIVLFSDIKNFTTIAETTDPDRLMEYICEYFDALTKVIVEEQGTIDKYIGDSIMAFWGAPYVVENPAQHAADAALKCVSRLEQINKIWYAERKIQFKTRFGIHSGDAIVGNVGSSERLNYTALGDTINIASRLENLNKQYGTQILITEDFYQKIQNDFVIRFVDCVAVKGITVIKKIYELLARKNQAVAFDVDTYNTFFAKGFLAYTQQDWNNAIALFTQCINVYPDDTVAPVFIARCEQFKTHPPKEDWQGVWRY